MAAFEAAIHESQEVVSCWHVSGGFDYGMVIAARDLSVYERFVRVTFVENPLVRTHKASIVLNAVKVGAPLPVYLTQPESA